MTENFYYPSYLNRDLLVAILDADAATCEALSVLFRLEGFQTSFAMDTASFIAAIERRAPDAAIVNIRIGKESGLDILRRVKSKRNGTPVFILEDHPEVDLAVLAMRAGATDVITKPIDSERLLRGVRDAVRENVHVGTIDGGKRNVEVRGFAQLTPREREVLQLITNGQSNKEAGRNLGISPRTIEVHRARVMEKLGARNTADLMRIVLTS
ncbi:MAG: LuxR C-terminal-related transcriptional regulator [Devosia sp.]|nr:LuxR C-terminal-related transcriptional regulator [Devosia sp.]